MYRVQCTAYRVRGRERRPLNQLRNAHQVLAKCFFPDPRTHTIPGSRHFSSLAQKLSFENIRAFTHTHASPFSIPHSQPSIPMIRVATRDDLPGIVQIYNQAIRRYSERGETPVTAFVEPLTVADRRSWFEQHGAERYPIWVFDRSGEAADGECTVAGWCSLSPYRSGRAALRHVAEASYYVADEHQRQGIGSALLSHAVEAVPELGFRAVIAVLLGVNDASIGLLEAHGFEQWGRLPEIATFNDNRYDHLIFGRAVEICAPGQRECVPETS